VRVKSFTLLKKVEVEHFTSERTRKPNDLYGCSPVTQRKLRWKLEVQIKMTDLFVG